MIVRFGNNRHTAKDMGAEDRLLLPRAAARRHLCRMKGATLAVLISLILRSNDRGWAEADIPQLERETGYRSGAVQRAVGRLCKQEVDGQRLLLAVKERDMPGVATKTHFLLFPTATDIVRYEGAR